VRFVTSSLVQQASGKVTTASWHAAPRCSLPSIRPASPDRLAMLAPPDFVVQDREVTVRTVGFDAHRYL
jgi:hypothetical protein